VSVKTLSRTVTVIPSAPRIESVMRSATPSAETAIHTFSRLLHLGHTGDAYRPRPARAAAHRGVVPPQLGASAMQALLD